jgi:hypothetical protein
MFSERKYKLLNKPFIEGFSNIWCLGYYSGTRHIWELENVWEQDWYNIASDIYKGIEVFNLEEFQNKQISTKDRISYGRLAEARRETDRAEQICTTTY